MLIQGGFRHVKEKVSVDEFLKFLAHEAPAAQYFVAQPPPGIVMTAAVGWRVIVPDSGAMEALALALWSGYLSLATPLQDEPTESRPMIFIQMKNHKGESDQFTLGKDFDKKELFIHRVRESAAVLAPKNKEAALQHEIEATLESEYWLRVG